MSKNPNIEIFDSRNIDSLHWEDYKNGSTFKNYFAPLIKKGVKLHIENVDVEQVILVHGTELIPMSIAQQKKKSQAYVASNIGQYFDYPIEEFQRFEIVKGWKKTFSILSLRVLRKFSSVLKIDECVFINSFLLSSNLCPKNYEEIPELIAYLKNKYPNKCFVFKGVSPEYNEKLFVDLSQSKFKPVFSRELYFISKTDDKYQKKRAFIRDRKHADKRTDILWDSNDKLDQNEKSQFLKFYEDLYIGKYSNLNPKYTIEFLNNIAEGGFFRIGSLKKGNDFLGAQVLFQRDGMITTPFIGYNRDLPQEMGIYRILNYYLMDKASKSDLNLNLSSGAAEFKKQRGGVSGIEYNMVFVDHLHFLRKLPWIILGFIGRRFVIPNLSKVKL